MTIVPFPVIPKLYICNTATMDWNDLRNQVSNLSVYDIKAGVRKVQNGMFMQCMRPRTSSNATTSCHELHRDGGEGTRGDQQRAVGRINHNDAGDRERHSQLVRHITLEKPWTRTDML